MSSGQAQNLPDEPPPSYSQATGGSSSFPSRPHGNTSTTTGNDHLSVPGPSRPTLSDAARRSMEDQSRPLPPGWARCYDDKQHHQFFVDTTQDPPRSIWVHPYDDPQYIRSLPSAEQERIARENEAYQASTQRNNAIYYDSETDDEAEHRTGAASSSRNEAQLPPRPTPKEKPSLGRKLKDKLTGMTHEEREAERRKRAEAERQAYEQHLKFRQAMARAAETGRPQLLGRDRNGKEVYVEPPSYGAGYPGAGNMYGPNGYGYNPYAQGMYASPNSAYMRPVNPYGRPYRSGMGMGGAGYGLPLALGGGLLGGMLLGDMMF